MPEAREPGLSASASAPVITLKNVHKIYRTGEIEVHALRGVSLEVRQGEFVFAGIKQGRPISEKSLLKVVRGRRPGITVHGFRSTFRDWAAETTSFPNHVIEMALAHSVSDAVEAAYRRGDLLEKRRKLMEAWASYCERTPAEVVHFKRAGSR